MADFNITAFNSGIISPLIQGRVDFDKYSRGCEDIVNFDVLKGGGLRRRFKTLLLTTVGETSARIEPFVFSSEQIYIIVFSDKKATVFSRHGIVIDELETPYSGSDINELQLLQSADVIFITHGKYPLNTINRYQDGWTFEEYRFDFMPFETKLKKSQKLDISADVAAWDNSTTYQTGDYVLHNNNFFQSLEDDNTGNQPPIPDDTHWKLIGSNAYIYEGMPATIATNSQDDIFPLSIENAYYMIENKRKENSIEETFTGSGISKTLYIKGDYQFRSSDKWNGTITIEKADSESADGWIVVNQFVANEDVNYNQSGVEKDGAFYRINANLSSGNAKVSLSNQNFTDKGIFKVEAVDDSGSVDRGLFYTNNAILHYECEDNAATNVVVDSKGSNNGTLAKSTTNAISTDGIIDNGLDLDDNRINFGIDLSSYKFTVSMWVKLHKETTLFNYRDVILLKIDSSGIVSATSKTTKSRENLNLNSSNKVKFGEWVHIAFSYKKSGRAAIYINGSIDGIANVSGRGLLIPSNTKFFCSDCVADEIIVFSDIPSSQVDIYRLYSLNSNKYKATCLRRVENNIISDRWARNLFNGFNGYTTSCFIFENRLWLTGNDMYPNTVIASKISEYDNFKYGSNDDEALFITIDSGKQDLINWITASRELVVGTNTAEWLIRSSSQTKSISPETVEVKAQTFIGSMKKRPIIADGRLVFATSDGKSLRDFSYQYEFDGFGSTDISVLIDNLFTDTIKKIVYKQYPFSIIYVLLENGELIALTFDTANNIIAASRYEIDARIIDICSLAYEGGEDLYLLVERNGVVAILATEPEDIYQDGIHLDFVKKYSNIEERKDFIIANTTALYGRGYYGYDVYGVNI